MELPLSVCFLCLFYQIGWKITTAFSGLFDTTSITSEGSAFLATRKLRCSLFQPFIVGIKICGVIATKWISYFLFIMQLSPDAVHIFLVFALGFP